MHISRGTQKPGLYEHIALSYYTRCLCQQTNSMTMLAWNQRQTATNIMLKHKKCPSNKIVFVTAFWQGKPPESWIPIISFHFNGILRSYFKPGWMETCPAWKQRHKRHDYLRHKYFMKCRLHCPHHWILLKLQPFLPRRVSAERIISLHFYANSFY